MSLDVAAIRRQFPALTRHVAGRPALFLDTPGGTQVPERVLAAMRRYLTTSNANGGGVFVTSRETGELMTRARAALAAFVGTDSPDGIVVGANMTTLTFAFSRAVARGWRAGDEVVVTSLDHDANVAPWLMAAEDRGALARTLAFDAHDGALPVAGLRALLSPRTRVVALTMASNALGTLPALAPLIAAAHEVGALVFVDAVHAAPHLALDVAALGCDALVCSAYKFCGPHLGILWARPDLLESLAAYKLRPAPAHGPAKWETGTPSYEAVAGTLACLGYLAELGDGVAVADDAVPTRAAVRSAMQRIRTHERTLSERFLRGAAGITGLRVHGLDDPTRSGERTPTFGLTLDALSSPEACARLAQRGVFAWAGSFYAVGVIEQLAVADRGGLLRLGFAHYHDGDDVDRALTELAELAR